MTHQSILRFITLAAACCAASAAFAGTARPPADMPRRESVRVNPKLIGFEAFTAGTPVRKFRRRTATGTMYFAFWDAAVPPGGAIGQCRDEWHEIEELDPGDYTGRAFREKLDASRRYHAESASFPLIHGGTLVEPPDTDWYDGLVNLPPETNPPGATHRRITGRGTTVPRTPPPGLGKALGEYDEKLEVEDTEDDAINRLKAQLELPVEKRAPGAVETGAEPAAFFTRRTAAGWTIQKTRHVATFQVGDTGRSTFRIDYRIDGEKRAETFTVANPASGRLTVVVDATPQPYAGLLKDAVAPDFTLKVDQPGRQYVIEGVWQVGTR